MRKASTANDCRIVPQWSPKCLSASLVCQTEIVRLLPFCLAVKFHAIKDLRYDCWNFTSDSIMFTNSGLKRPPQWVEFLT